MSESEFSGIWCCRYWFPSNTHPGEEELSEYQVAIHKRDDTLVLESLPNADESYMLVRLVLDGPTLAGSWQEYTSPHGEFKATVYSGVVQLLYDADKKQMNGRWVGIGRDREKDELAVYGGRWEVVYLGDQLISRPSATGSTRSKE